jgi:outer membrane receptor protein involved in Fe transport
MFTRLAGLGAFVVFAGTLFASVFGTVRVIVHDPQHRAIPNANVTLEGGAASTQTAHTDSAGVAQLTSVPIGPYRLVITAPGFATAELPVTAVSDRVQELHVPLEIEKVEQSVDVQASADDIDVTSSTPQTSITSSEILRTPGADRTNSMKFITDFVPGAYMVHDQLHVRGGHQVTWAIDGVPLPNTNIASNVGPQFDPKDVTYIEAQRGAYMADYGDRTYGVFNVAPHSGFERQRTAELVASYGSYNQTDDQLSFGDHTDRFAYYFSVNGNRSDYGLAPPIFDNIHNQSAGGGAFTSLTYNAHNGDQYRFAGQFRGDFYQVPNNPTDATAGVNDREREQDSFGVFTYLHPIGSSLVLTASPFFHFNRAAYEGGPTDVPIPTDNRASTYAGGQLSLAYVKGRHNAKVGLYAFGQHDNTFFSLIANDGTGTQLQQRDIQNGALEAVFLEDQFHATNWLTLNGGVRITHFAGSISETAASPRVGAAIVLPRVHWVVRGSYNRFYQAPPLSTVSGPLLELATTQGFGFLPLRGERDEAYEFGLAIPLRGWDVDLSYFHTAARNFFDHDVLGNSNIFFPLTIDRARIRGFETSVKSPKLMKYAQFHLAYSHQYVQGAGGVTGGLTDFTPPDTGLFYLDHDQRDTLSTGVVTDLPSHAWFAAELSYGSGFLNGDGPDHLPSYHTVDLSIGKSFGERFSAKFTATNVGNARYFVDLSNTFGGSHVNDPRMLVGELRWRFKY